MINGSRSSETADPATRRATMPTKAPKEAKTLKEAKASKETRAPKEIKAPKAVTAPKEKGGKAEPASAGGQKPNALQKPLQPSKELAAVVGTDPFRGGES